MLKLTKDKEPYRKSAVWVHSEDLGVDREDVNVLATEIQGWGLRYMGHVITVFSMFKGGEE